MRIEWVLSIILLAGFIWTLRFMLPRARRKEDFLALASTVLIALILLLSRGSC
ncbi:MAG: hypothetical protein H0X67_04565 [Acidobacteria bacterium]|nr:hypothetical protein [Acidobacteriota bacterium]